LIRIRGFQGIRFDRHLLPGHVDGKMAKDLLNGFPTGFVGAFHDKDLAHCRISMNIC
jgi:hypothetical protein